MQIININFREENLRFVDSGFVKLSDEQVKTICFLATKCILQFHYFLKIFFHYCIFLLTQVYSVSVFSTKKYPLSHKNSEKRVEMGNFFGVAHNNFRGQ